MLSSRWPRSPLHGKCSKRFCGSATAAATTSASVRRSMSCIQEQPTERSASKCGEKLPDQPRDQACGLPEVLVAVSTSRLSGKRAGKTRTLMPFWDLISPGVELGEKTADTVDREWTKQSFVT